MTCLELWILEEASGFRFLWTQRVEGEGPPSTSVRAARPRMAGARTTLDPALRREIERASDQAAAKMDRLGRGAETRDEEAGPLQRLGALIHQRVLPDALREAIEALPQGCPILLTADEPGLPWELAFDGSEFLVLAHPIGRRRLLGGAEPVPGPSPGSGPGAGPRSARALIVGNPSQDLDAADAEAAGLLEVFDAAPDIVRADLLCRAQATRARVLEALAGGAYGLIHFACHARDGALRMADGDLTPEEIKASLRGRPLVYLNACASARGRDAGTAERSGVDGLVEALLSAGASGVIGTRWPVYDDRSAALAEAFYRALVMHAPLAEALRAARVRARDRWPAEAAWAAPVLYGDPTSRPLRPRWSRHRGTCLVLRFADPASAAGVAAEPVTEPRPPAAASEFDEIASAEDLEARAGMLRRLAADLEQQGARIARIDGRGLAALFGVPDPREDDAPRAAAAAMGLLDPRTGASLGMAIGIESGTISLDERGLGAHALPLYTGAAIEAAETIAEAASTDEIRVGPLAARLCAERYHFESLPEQEQDADERARGADGPPSPSGERPGFRLLGRRRQLLAAPDPFVGREREMARLLERAASAGRGSGGVVGISGEAGVGKSGLLQGFRQAVESSPSPPDAPRPRPLWIHVDPDMSGGQPFAGLAALLEALASATQADTMEAAEDPRTRRLLRALVGGVGEDDLDMDAGDRGRLVHHLRQQVARLLKSAPLFLAVENAQRLDVSSLEILEQAFTGIERMPVLLMLLHRPSWRHGWSSQPAFQQLSLEPLERDAVRALLRHRLCLAEGVDSAALEPLIERSGGNPFFAEELARALRESAGWDQDGPEPGLALPETVERLLLARLGRLAPASRMALETAAVLDAPFAPALLQALTGQERIEATIADLESQGLLVSRWETGELLLRHALVGEAARQNLPASRRRNLNRNIARRLTAALAQQRGAGSDAPDAAGPTIGSPLAQTSEAALVERIARHAFAAVHDAGEGLDPEAGPDALLEAARTLLAAGALARRRFAARQAAAHYRNALILIEPLDERASVERVDAFEGHGDACDLLGRFDEAIEAYSRAFDALTKAGASEPEAEAPGRFRIRVEPKADAVVAGAENEEDMPDAEGSAGRGNAGDPARTDRRRAADLARRIGRLLGWGARYDEALAWMERGRALLDHRLRAEERGTVALIHIHTGTIHYYRGQLDLALEHVQRGLGVVDGTDHARARATGQNLLGAVHDAKGNHEQALRAYARSLELWEAADDPYEAARVRDNIGVTSFHLGNWAEAEAQHRHALDFFELVEDRDQQAFARLNLGNVLLARGEHDAAEACFARAESLAVAVGSPRIEAMAKLNRAHRAIAQQAADEAIAILRESESVQRESRIEDLVPETEIAWGRAKRLLGDSAIEHGQAALAGAEAAGLQLEEGLAQRLLGQARADRGDMNKAQQHLRWSLGILEGLSQSLESERSRLALAGVLFEMGRTEEALASLAKARAALASLGAAQDLAEADALAERLGLRPNDRLGS